MKRVVIHIDELALKGFRHEDRLSFAEGMKAELGRQFASSELLRSVIARSGTARLKVGPVHVGASDQPAAIGAAAACRIAKEIGR